MTKKKETAPKEPKTGTAIITKPQAMVSVPALISQAFTAGASVEAMKGLYDLYTLERNDQRRMAFNQAMAKLQSEMPIIKKTTPVKNDGGKILYMYAKIEAIVDQVKKPIERNGFSYQVKTGANGTMLFATCIVKHVGGWSEETTFEVPATAGTQIMSGPQKQAASLTFAKRYAFCNAFGIMTGDDDTDATEGRVDKAAPVEKTQFEIAADFIAKTTDRKTLEAAQKSVMKNTTFTNQEKIKLCERIHAKLGK